MLPDLAGKTLPAVSLFAGLTPTEFVALQRPWLSVRYPAGHCLVASSMTGEWLYVLRAGQVVLQSAQGEVLTVLGAGATLGEMGLVGLSLAPYEAYTAVASELYLLSRAHVEQMIRTRPLLALNILQHLSILR